jgi:hypothetical protein
VQSFDANKPATQRSSASALPPEDTFGPAIVAGGIGRDISPGDPGRVQCTSTETIVDFASPFQAGPLEPACPYDPGICIYTNSLATRLQVRSRSLPTSGVGPECVKTCGVVAPHRSRPIRTRYMGSVALGREG